ncbi:RNA polymerase [Bacteroidia bacterium]|nr:RNA polymerase [Bacteroidia bacterium]
MQFSSSDISIDVWEKFRKGDSQAFSTIYYSYARDMFAYGCHFTDNRDLIKDCMHDVFVKVFNLRNNLQKENLKSYLIKAMRNELYRAFRDAKETIPIEENEGEFAPVYSVEEHYIEQVQEENRRNYVQKILSILTPNQRQVIIYKYMEDFSIQEIADIIGINYQSVQNLIQRSIQKIKKQNTSTKDINI